MGGCKGAKLFSSLLDGSIDYERAVRYNGKRTMVRCEHIDDIPLRSRR